MRYGILSDIHSNLEALTAVLDVLHSKGIEHFLSSGDIVGYGPNPNECVNELKKLPFLKIAVGNHDRAACGMKDLRWFNEYAKKAVIWTAGELTEKNKMYLSELPKKIFCSSYTVVHGSVIDPINEYLLTHQQFLDNGPLLKSDVTFTGHTHVPQIFAAQTGALLRGDELVQLSKSEKFIINPGSVGQPRDGNPKAACAIYDSEEKTIEFIRVKYDVHATEDKMRKARLPGILIQRLHWGK